MTKYTAFIVIIALRIFYPPTSVQAEIAPFASSSHLTTSSIYYLPAKVISLNGTVNDNKVILNWEVSENETAAKFEVEKSIDGMHFSMAALVFSTDKSNIDQYQFFEKVGSEKTLYRIKVINKNQEMEYSKVIEIIPAV